MAQAGVAKVNELCSVVNIPSISELGVNRNKFIKRLDKMAEDALNSGSPANTYRQPSKKEIIGIYKKLIN
jgi:1,3-propanediol dehydrogenase